MTSITENSGVVNDKNTKTQKEESKPNQKWFIESTIDRPRGSKASNSVAFFDISIPQTNANGNPSGENVTELQQLPRLVRRKKTEDASSSVLTDDETGSAQGKYPSASSAYGVADFRGHVKGKYLSIRPKAPHIGHGRISHGFSIDSPAENVV